MPLKASRRSAVEPFIVMDVMRAAVDREEAGAHIVHMEVGQPGARAPRAVLEAARVAIEDGRLAYTEALGLRRLRARIARHYGEAHGLDVPVERIAVTTGSSAGFMLAFLAAFDPGDRVAIAAPGYPAYRNIMTALGLAVVDIPTRPENRHVITPAPCSNAYMTSGTPWPRESRPRYMLTRPAARPPAATTGTTPQAPNGMPGTRWSNNRFETTSMDFTSAAVPNPAATPPMEA
ncbi:aminotransferase class I/II-fold pyridoxal phosphate-dependent enzyme [bacterium]|nr:aminotransferase class I/II-fold pyridoxal phosphate-dependent enzyme [bacterium]